MCSASWRGDVRSNGREGRPRCCTARVRAAHGAVPGAVSVVGARHGAMWCGGVLRGVVARGSAAWRGARLGAKQGEAGCGGEWRTGAGVRRLLGGHARGVGAKWCAVQRGAARRGAARRGAARRGAARRGAARRGAARRGAARRTHREGLPSTAGARQT